MYVNILINLRVLFYYWMPYVGLISALSKLGMSFKPDESRAIEEFCQEVMKITNCLKVI